MKEWLMCEAKAGDMLRVNVGPYYHYGIFVGNDEVVEFGEANNVSSKPETVKIIKVDINQFCGGKFVEVAKFTRAELKRKKNTKQICEYALSRLGEGGYNFLTNNCQHFANECVFGEKISEDVDTLRKRISDLLNK